VSTRELSEFFALPPEDVGIEAIQRFSGVKRWHMVETSKSQSLAEHSAIVAMLAYYVAHTAPGMYFGPGVGVLLPALTHDLVEVFTGDIVPMTKGRIKGLKNLEFALDPVLFSSPADHKVMDLIKLCDLSEGMRFIKLHGIGTIVPKWAGNGLWMQHSTLVSRVSKEWPTEVLSHYLGVHYKYIST